MKDKLVIDFDVPQQDMQKFFDVVEFLETNKETIIEDIRPLVLNYLDREDMFDGPFSLAHTTGISDVILDLLKDKVLDNFNFNYEEVECLMDRDLMELTGTIDSFLDKDNYIV